jgi:hypothetical protein
MKTSMTKGTAVVRGFSVPLGGKHCSANISNVTRAASLGSGAASSMQAVTHVECIEVTARYEQRLHPSLTASGLDHSLDLPSPSTLLHNTCNMEKVILK